MNAHTAQQYRTTSQTQKTNTVETVTSLTPQRIDSFIKEKLKEARSENGCGIIDCATRAEALGFVSSANVRYSEFLKLFQNSTPLTSRYQETYPSSLFLPWGAFHALLKAMDLWVDLPQNYLGAIPPEQIPWMEIFELNYEDQIKTFDLHELLNIDKDNPFNQLMIASCPRNNFDDFEPESNRYNHLISMVKPYLSEAGNSFFVVAPKDAFSTTEDWLSRFRKLVVDPKFMNKTPPDDPLVIRFCQGGALVVAAWGDEAALLNKATAELNL